jgi:hypothetical protein
MADAMVNPIARRLRIGRSPGGVVLTLLARLIRPTIVIGMMAVLIDTAATPAVLPAACRITWTMVGHTVIYMPDCSHQSSPASQPSSDGPPPGPGTPPGTPPTP